METIESGKAVCIDWAAYVIDGRSRAEHIDLMIYQAHQAHHDGDSSMQGGLQAICGRQPYQDVARLAYFLLHQGAVTL